ncbi:hypothetical protein HPULCUR_000079 [Helicostylum pulchrum]|uniref:Putative ER transporter 6TM N-terminal domain-containing protein n=1 Tax=Helicostylum pulchrum TaxID=562976 RepID=A0ABP9XJV7_9FUNG
MKFTLNKDKGLWKKIIKCTIAYEIGTIIVLIPQVSQNIGAVPYLVTLGTLFFNPSSTAGNEISEMCLNVMMLVPACIWVGIISYICTIYNSHIESSALYSNGAGIIAAIAFFISVFITAYLRLKYPRLFIPSLQGFIVPFFGLTKGIYSTEFNIMSILGIFYPVLIGGSIALVVNLAIWPETAAKVSETALGSAITSIYRVLEFIDVGILKECEVSFSDLTASKKLRQIIQTLDDDISKMQASRREAKYEIVISYYCPTWYKSLAKTLEGLSKNLYGFSLAVEREGQVISYQSQTQSEPNKPEQRTPRIDKHDQVITKRQTTDIIALATTNKVHGTKSRIEYKLISRLQSSVQPEIKTFVQICTAIILCICHRLQDNDAIPKQDTTNHVCSHHHSHQHDLTEAMQSLNQAKIILQKEYEERRAEPQEDHFLIYTVLFSLSQFGEKLIELERQAEGLISKRQSYGRFPRLFFPRVNFKKWIREAGENAKGERNPAERVIFEQHLDESRRRESRQSDSDEENRCGSVEKRISSESDWTNFDDQETTPLQNAPGSHVWNKWLHSFSEWVGTDPVRYAMKFTVTMELLALMAWLPITGVNELYNSNHGQWALLSAMVVFNFTVGSTALQCMFRVLATVTGAVAGYICILASNRNERPYALALLALVFQIPMWYTLLATKYPRIGFISLLTMAVINSTNYSDNVYQESLFAPVWKRSVTAFLAILVVLLVDQILWPVWARKMVRKNLSDLLIDTGIQFSKVVSLVCQENTQSYRYKATLIDAEYHTKALKRQHHLTCQMLTLAEMEPRITKASFPIATYRAILQHEQQILYWIEHLLVTQAYISKDVRRQIMYPMNAYRKELAASVHLYLFTLACSLRTKSALPASLPSAEISRKILQQRQAILWHENYDEIIQAEGSGVSYRASIDVEESNKRKEERSAENQIYWQTYAAGSVEVIVEQEAMGVLVAELMGQHVFKAATRDWIE